MPKFRLGRRRFPVNCEVISASRAGVSSKEVALLTQTMRGPGVKFGRVKILNLVRPVFRNILLFFWRYDCDAWLTEQE
jgi:hypothetical protein